MMTTLTLLGNRIAQAFDYPDNQTVQGESFRTGPTKIGGQSLAVNFYLDGNDVVLDRVIDMHTNQPLLPSFAVTELLQRHCESYVAAHQNLRQRAEAP